MRVLHLLACIGVLLLTVESHSLPAQGQPPAREGTPNRVRDTLVRSRPVTLRGTVRSQESGGIGVVMQLVPLDPGSSPGAKSYGISTDASGAFTITDVLPGRYLLTARKRTVPLDTAAEFAAVSEIVVGDEDRNDLVLHLQPGGVISGRILIDGAVPSREVQARLVLRSAAQASIDSAMPVPGAAVDRQGRFTLAYLMPGSHRLTVHDTATGLPLTIASQRIDGRETVHGGIELDLGTNVDGVEVQATTRAHALRGHVTQKAGLPFSSMHVIVFPADVNVWRVTHRIYAARPDQNGSYLFANLPPGDYLVAVAGGLAVDDWLNPAVLSRLQPAAVAVTIADERTELNLPSAVPR